MKNKIFTRFATVIAFFTIWTLSTSKVSAQGNGQISFDVFYNELSPYGYWDNDRTYGDIWYPQVENGFRPYGTNGYWTMTQYGNTWVSNYAWGWAPFHYGRWVNTAHRGWGWVPGYEWGPAWVEWRSGNGYYGWAPSSPRLSINISIGLPMDIWIFAPSRRIYDHNIYRHSYYGRPNIYNNTTIINNTYIVNNNHYHGGPSRRDIERSTGRRVNVREVHQSSRPGASRVDGRSVSIYRPDFDRNSTRSTANNNSDNNSTSRRNNEGRISREMYIDKDGRSTLRNRNERSTLVNEQRRSENTSDRTSPVSNRSTAMNRNSQPSSSRENSSSHQTDSRNNSRTNRREETRVNPSNKERIQREQRAIPQRDTNPRQDRQRATQNTGIIRQASNPGSNQRENSARSTRASNGTSSNNATVTRQSGSSRTERSSDATSRRSSTSTNNDRSTGRGSR